MTDTASTMTGPARSLPRLHVVTDDDTLARPDWTRRAVEVLEAGGPAVALHVRGPRTSGRALFEHVERLLPVARSCAATLIVNDRVDVALVTACDGAHLPSRSLPVAVARELVGAGRVLGRSVHDPSEVARVEADGADYAFVGTIFPTPSHEGVPGIGAIGLRDAIARRTALPVIGIGGIDERRVGEVIAAGAHGVAVMRSVWDRPEPGSAVESLVRALDGAKR